jgi:hypothetical protein
MTSLENEGRKGGGEGGKTSAFYGHKGGDLCLSRRYTVVVLESTTVLVWGRCVLVPSSKMCEDALEQYSHPLGIHASEGGVGVSFTGTCLATTHHLLLWESGGYLG